MKTALKTAALAASLLAAIPLTALLAQGSPAPFTVEETGRGYTSLQAAVDAIGDGQGTIAIAPGNHRQCAVQTAGEIAYMALVPGEAVFDAVTCEGKAALVLRGRGAQVSGLVFQNMNVRDFNGAGIRLEHGNLTVAQSWFRDSQQGILTADDTTAQLVVDRSTFTRLGTCEGAGGCAHSIYTGSLGQVRITNSRFEQGRGGHYAKVRSARVDIAGCSFDDSGGRATNYKENYSAFIAVAAENRDFSSAGLVVAGNNARFAPGVDRTSVFVADWSGEVRQIEGNVLGRNLTRYELR
jgi:hypothetical protein